MLYALCLFTENHWQKFVHTNDKNLLVEIYTEISDGNFRCKHSIIDNVCKHFLSKFLPTNERKSSKTHTFSTNERKFKDIINNLLLQFIAHVQICCMFSFDFIFSTSSSIKTPWNWVCLQLKLKCQYHLPSTTNTSTCNLFLALNTDMKDSEWPWNDLGGVNNFLDVWLQNSTYGQLDG